MASTRRVWRGACLGLSDAGGWCALRGANQSYFRFGSGMPEQPASDRSFMFAQARIVSAACRVSGIGSAAVVEATHFSMTGIARPSHEGFLPQVAQVSMNQSFNFYFLSVVSQRSHIRTS